MSELPPNAGPPDDVDDRYRRAAALDPGRPSDSVRRAVLEHAAKLAAERSLGRSVTQSADDIPAKLGVERSAANQRRWRPAVFGTLAAAGIAGLLIAPQYLPHQAPSTVAQSKIEATRPRTDAAPAPPVARLKESEMQAEEAPQRNAPPQSPPAMAQRQSMAKDRAVAGNAAAIAESAQDKTSSYDEAPKRESRPNATGITGSITGRLSAPMTDARNQDSAAALRRAAETGDVQGLKVLLERNVDIDARDAGGRTALMLATLRGQLPAVEALLSAGADANAPDAGGVTPLQAAMNANQPAIATALRGAGAR